MWGCAVTFHDDRSQNALKRVIGENLEGSQNFGVI
jgi:hypothetical protein